jgi:carboxylate-amine ligase
VFAFPLSGRAPFTLSWAEFETGYFAHMERTGVVKSMKDFYWDIRPKPEYGTIELRVCDTPLAVGHAAALAAYLQALCAWLLDRRQPPPREDDYLVYNYNRFQACRFGLEGSIVLPQDLAMLPLRADILSTLRHLAPQAERLGSRAALAQLERMILSGRGNDAGWLRQRGAAQGGPAGMVDAALRAFRSSVEH